MISSYFVRDIFVSLILVFIVLCATSFGLLYTRYVKIDLPPIGRANWVDATFILAGVSLMPVVLVVLPSTYLAVFIAGSFLMSLYSLFDPLFHSRILAFSMSLGLILVQVQLRNIWINDILVVLALSLACTFFIQGGMFLREIAYLAVGYSVYDIVSVALFQNIFASALSRIPLIPLVVVQFGGLTRIIGGGDLLLLGMFVLILSKPRGTRRLILFLSCEIFLIFLMYAFVITPVGLPLSPILTPLFLVASLASKRGRKAHAPST